MSTCDVLSSQLEVPRPLAGAALSLALHSRLWRPGCGGVNLKKSELGTQQRSAGFGFGEGLVGSVGAATAHDSRLQGRLACSHFSQAEPSCDPAGKAVWTQIAMPLDCSAGASLLLILERQFPK